MHLLRATHTSVTLPKNQSQTSQGAESQDTSSLKRKKNAQPFHKYRRPWHKLRAQEQSQSTWKTAAAAVFTAACLTGELGRHPRARDSLQAPDKLRRAPRHGERPPSATLIAARQPQPIGTRSCHTLAAPPQKPEKHAG